MFRGKLLVYFGFQIIGRRCSPQSNPAGIFFDLTLEIRYFFGELSRADY